MPLAATGQRATGMQYRKRKGNVVMVGKQGRYDAEVSVVMTLCPIGDILRRAVRRDVALKRSQGYNSLVQYN